MNNIDLIDSLLEQKPLMSYKGEHIYQFMDVSKFIDLMPASTSEETRNPIIVAGAL